jgi:hypothetical protein
MQFTQIERPEFGSFLADLELRSAVRNSLSDGQPQSPPRDNALWVCWNDLTKRVDSLPSLLIVRDEQLEEFFAWAISFLPTFRPLSSFVRVLPWSSFTSARQIQQRSLELPVSALIGAILGETLINATGRGYLSSLAITAFESTYFSAVSQAILAGFPDELLHLVDEGWHITRDLTGQPERKLARHWLADVSSIVLRLAGHRNSKRQGSGEDADLLEHACREIQAGGMIPSFIWNRLSGGRISSSLADAMTVSKERRVELFEKTANLLTDESSNPVSAGFLVGYLANLVSDGSLEHAHLVFPLKDRLPTAMLWYGICAGLAPENRVQSDYDHLGLRIRRAIYSPETLLSTPSCDIAIQELNVLLRSDPRARSFRQRHGSIVRVEIAPCISTVVRSGVRQGSAGQINLFSGEERPLLPDSEKILELVNSLKATLGLAEGILDQRSRAEREASNLQRGKRRR